MKRPNPTPPAIEALVQGYVEGALTEAQAGTLKLELERRPDLQEVVLEQLETETLLRYVVRGGALAPANEDFAPSKRAPKMINASHLFSKAKITLALAMAAALTLLATAIFWFLPHSTAPMLAYNPSSTIELARRGNIFHPSSAVDLLPGDLLSTGTNASSQIVYRSEQTTIILGSGAELRVLPWSRGKQFELLQGELRASVAPQPIGKPMIFRTADADARVVGTELQLRRETNSTRLEVTEGKVRLSSKSSNDQIDVAAGSYAVAARGRKLTTLPLTGFVYREYWTNVTGTLWLALIQDKRYPDSPDGVDRINNLEEPANWGDHYGVRVRGFIHPPEDGNYTFYLAASSHASFWLSRDSSPERRVQMATSDAKSARDWTSNPAQRSANIHLEAGQRYYFEIVQIADVGGDHLAVGWSRDGGAINVVPGNCISPFPTRNNSKGAK